MERQVHGRGSAHRTRPTRNRASVRDYEALVQEFAEEHLLDYIKRINSLPSLRGKLGKELNDAIWRTVTLQSFEVLILDSPLMQRLRRIRQLGVAHLVYPCAGHSRLEHSIGAVHQVQKLIDSLNRGIDDGGGIHLPSEWANLLRLAALCHDIGHGLMSHVVENALKASGVTDRLMIELQEELDLEGCSLSEAAAYFILDSDSFAELVAIAKEKTNHQLPEDWQKALCDAVVGRPINDKWPLLHELISGPFDADKLDWMSRDAQMAGIPDLTDIPRLIQKVRVAEVAQEKLPHEISSSVSGKYDTYYVQGIALSGGRTLDELMIARTLLFDKIYRHQKTRAVEAMVANAISMLLPFLDMSRQLTLPLDIDDEDFIALTKDTIATRLRMMSCLGRWNTSKSSRTSLPGSRNGISS